MKQYLNLLKHVKKNGVIKNAARVGMPKTKSVFGYQFRHDLSNGFPLLTTKEVNFKNIVVELLWFLRGDTNIKYLVDNGCNIWNEDAYNYYCKLCNEGKCRTPVQFEKFIEFVKSDQSANMGDYKYGDCGYQYGKVWRNWEKHDEFGKENVDQIANIILSLKNNPESRRHILTSIDPAHDKDLALFWCHALTQFNCRKLDYEERALYFYINVETKPGITLIDESTFDEYNVPKYFLDCQMYQRSADSFLGVPYNIASYALLTEILCKVYNMAHGDMIYSYGDLHIYENHFEQVEEQISRTEKELPLLKFSDEFLDLIESESDISKMLSSLTPDMFEVCNYNPLPKIKAKLSTGLK